MFGKINIPNVELYDETSTLFHAITGDLFTLKLVLLVEESGREVSYVNKESKKPHGPYVDAYPEEEDPWYED